MSELSVVLVGALAGVVLANVTAVAFGYYAAMRQVERLARIDPPETPELFERDRAARADQPLTAEDIDRIDEWEE